MCCLCECERAANTHTPTRTSLTPFLSWQAVTQSSRTVRPGAASQRTRLGFLDTQNAWKPAEVPQSVISGPAIPATAELGITPEREAYCPQVSVEIGGAVPFYHKG